MSIGRTAVRSALWSASGTHASFVVSFATGAVLARLVGPAPFGVYAIATAVCELIFIPAGVSFSQATVQLHARGRVLQDTVLLMSGALATLLFVGTAAATPLLRAAMGRNAAYAVVVLCAARGLNYVANALAASLEAGYRYRLLAAIKTGSAILTAGGVLAAALTGAGIEAVVAREALPAVATATLLLGASWRLGSLPTGRHWSWDATRDVLRVGAGWGAVRSVEIVLNKIDQLIVTRIAGPLVGGHFFQARYLASLPFAFVAPAIQQVALRTYAELNDRPAVQREMYSVTSFFLTRLLVPVAIAVGAFPEGLILPLLGDKWRAAAPLLACFAPWLVLFPLFEIAKALLMARSRYYSVAGTQLFAIAALIATAAIAAPRYGARAVALANGVAFAVAFVLLHRATRRVIGPAAESAGRPLAFVAAAVVWALALAVRSRWGAATHALPAMIAIVTTFGAAMAAMILVDLSTFRRNLRGILARAGPPGGRPAEQAPNPTAMS